MLDAGDARLGRSKYGLELSSLDGEILPTRPIVGLDLLLNQRSG